MKFPDLYEFSVGENIVNFFNEKFDIYSKNTKYLRDKNTCLTVNGVQTWNILAFRQKDIFEKLNELKPELEKKSNTQLDYVCCHLIEYNKGGYQLPHNHEATENFSVIIYLNDCIKGGETVFKLEKLGEIVINTVTPKKGKAVLFNSSIVHESKPCLETKRVLVVGTKFV
jgi:Rps23 Pro-64 3,4-dihydroxylase Tpa1-like proline 4-hydroxylase